MTHPADFLAVAPYEVIGAQAAIWFKLSFNVWPRGTLLVPKPGTGQGSWDKPLAVPTGPKGLPFLSSILYVSTLQSCGQAGSRGMLCCDEACRAVTCQVNGSWAGLLTSERCTWEPAGCAMVLHDSVLLHDIVLLDAHASKSCDMPLTGGPLDCQNTSAH